jgi:hypothetical protein
MVMDMAEREYYFSFAPDRLMKFEYLLSAVVNKDVGMDTYLKRLVVEASKIVKLNSLFPETNPLEEVLNQYLGLFYGQLGTMKMRLNWLMNVPVQSNPYQSALSKMKQLKEFVEDLLTKGVVRPSKSPYVSPAFLLPKSGGGCRMIVDYSKVNKICFDSYPTPKLEQAFQCFSGATVFSVLDLNSAYFQIPLTTQSRRITAFNIPFVLYEFNKLPIGIIVGCQGLSRVVDNLFADLKGEIYF